MFGIKAMLVEESAAAVVTADTLYFPQETL
jgi:hypothetical protein